MNTEAKEKGRTHFTFSHHDIKNIVGAAVVAVFNAMDTDTSLSVQSLRMDYHTPTAVKNRSSAALH